MKHVYRGTVLAAGIVLGLALWAPAFAEAQASNQAAPKLTDNEQRIFAKLQSNDPNPWYDPAHSGGGGAGGSGGVSGGTGTGSNGGGTGGTNSGSVVPEPGTIALLGLGLGALGVARRRQKAGQQDN